MFEAATQQPFLSHAGCGTLSASALAQWMVQDGHYTRGYIQFIGALIAKIRLPSVPNSQFNPMFRTLDLLISALNNIRREMSFFDITATKYGIHLNSDPPNHITRAYLDLFVAVSSPGASLLEGMVVLWSTEHVCTCFNSVLDSWANSRFATSGIDLPGCMPNPSAPRCRVPARNRTSPPFTNLSFRTGLRLPSLNLSMRVVAWLTS